MEKVLANTSEGGSELEKLSSTAGTMQIGEVAELTVGGNDVLVVKQEPMDELGFFSSNSCLLSGPDRDTDIEETMEKMESSKGKDPGRTDNFIKSEQVPVDDLDHFSTDLSSLSESLQEVASSTTGNSTNVSLVAYGSSGEESDSDDSPPSSGSKDSSPEYSSSSSSDSDSSDEEPTSRGARQNAEEETEEIKILEPPKTKKEVMLKDLPEVPFVDFRLGEDEEVSLLGKVSSIIGQLVVVASNKDNPALNDDTVLFKEDRHPIGVVFELFGPVPNPFYTVRFNSTKDITDMGLALGSNIYFAPKQEEITNYVFVKQLEAMKGTDASWANDEEPPPDAIEYSDDEAERAAKRVKTMEREKRKAAKRREEGGTPPDALKESGPRQRTNREENMHGHHQPGHQHQRRGPPQGHGSPHQPFNQRGPHQPFDQRGPHQPFDQRGPHPPFDQQGPHPRFDHRGPRPPFDQRGPHPRFDHRGPPPPFDQRGPRPPPFIHRGPHPPFSHQPFHASGPHEQYNHRGPHPVRQRFSGEPVRGPWTPPGMPPPPGGGMFHHGGYPHPSNGPPHQNGYGGY